ncbi:hypothetical protein E1176_18955 [Fulvivirga sp. RKSG066]|uniref:TPM domain-containing protein n=1 Tax=Fulvivirga aurantia TaxID=2529383 RepID=UPI0012BBD079|nr:TPM domain-containing protein [Fulvivirga aurantia]MTI23116.1 hypothetical protein [Fulvivirga aurantia]
MNKIFNVLCLIILLSTSISSCQGKQSNEQNKLDCPNVPKLVGRINDYADLLLPEQEEELTNKLEKLETDIGSQVVVLTINSLGEESIEEYSLRVANCWMIGRSGDNDGLLIAVALQNRKMRIEVGYGLEKIIKDHTAKNIIVNDMTPKFREQDYFGGLLSATNKIDSLIRSNVDLIGEQP